MIVWNNAVFLSARNKSKHTISSNTSDTSGLLLFKLFKQHFTQMSNPYRYVKGVQDTVGRQIYIKKRYE